MFTNETQAHSTDALRQKAFDALYQGDVETARALLIVEGVREAPDAALRWTQNRIEELNRLRNEVSGLRDKVQNLEEQLNPEDPGNYCPHCGQPA